MPIIFPVISEQNNKKIRKHSINTKLKILLTSPKDVYNPVNVKSIGYLPPDKERIITFKMKAIVAGSYDLKVIIKRKNEILFTLPFKFHTGTPQVQAIQQPTYTTVSHDLPSTMKCPYCGNDTEEYSKFCASCGKEITAKLKKPQMETCPNCGNKNKANSKFCQSCGKKLISGICQNCGSSLKIGEKFCGECGSKID